MSRIIISVSSLLLIGIANMATAQLIVAHRGASHDAPENTIAAFELAWQQGADAIEGDFQLTQDKRIVCVHDPDMKRTAGSKLVVSESTLDELRRLDVGSWKGKRFAGQRIPTLAEVFATVPPGKKLFLEIKCGIEIVPVLLQELRQSNFALDQLVVISFHADVIAEARKRLPEIESYWLTSFQKANERSGNRSSISAVTDRLSGPTDAAATWEPDAQQVLEILQQSSASGLSCKAHEAVDPQFVKQLNDAGYGFHCWTVNDPRLARRMIELGVQSITTDRPGWLRENLGLPIEKATTTDHHPTPTSVNDSEAEFVSFRVMTFNIWVGGEAGKQPLEKTVEVIKSARADVVGIQESEGKERRNSRIDNAEKVAKILGWSHINQQGSTSVISRFPIVEATPERWGVLIQVSDSESIYLFNAHLPDAPYQPYQLAGIKYGDDDPFIKTQEEAISEAKRARGKEVQEILAELQSVADRGLPMFLTGDMNEPSHQDWTAAAAQVGCCQIEVEYPTTKAFTDFGFQDAFRAFHPDEIKVRGYTWTPINAADDSSERHDRIDYIFFKSDRIKLLKVEVVGEATERGADIVVRPYPSDHRAVVAELRLLPTNK